MITGDYPVTAKNIAEQIGLRNSEEIITGPEILEMSPEELKEKIKKVNVFARMVPEQKLAIISALKANNEVVAMTGDGVNDAPALKAAHIGVAMGQRGTDVAREAADLVLLEDDFSSIVAAVRMGRRIFDNIRKAMSYVIVMHPPIFGLAFLPVIFDWPIILYPVHIAFLELIIDPVCSIVFEAEGEEKNIMRRPPRASKEPLFNKKMFALSFSQGFFSFLLVALVFALALRGGREVAEARTLAFIALVISNLSLILANRSWTKSILANILKPNKAMFWVFGGTFFFLALAVYLPPLQSIFHFTFMHPLDILLSLAVGMASTLWFELIKVVLRLRKIDLLH
jgi:Ca2+-transporting ATPase